MMNIDTKSPLPVSQEQMVERVVLHGDLSVLDDRQRLAYYEKICASLKLNPLTKPFDFLRLNGRLVMYAKKDCTDQLRSRHGITISNLTSEAHGDVYVVRAHARNKDGREDVDIGAVNIGGLKGDALANALMRAVTKSKRRVTLSLAGLGILDESELDTVTEQSPIVPPAAPVPPIDETPQPPRKASGDQLHAIYAQWTGRHHLERDSLNRWIYTRYGADRGRDLTEAQAAEALRLVTEIESAALVSQFANEPTRLERAAHAAKMAMAEVPDLAREMFGVVNLTQLTHNQLEELIDELSGRAQTTSAPAP